MNQSNNQTNNVYILTHDTDYMLLVSVIETFIAIATAVYMHIHITLFIEDSSLVGGVQWRVKKMIVNPGYLCRYNDSVSSTDLVLTFCPVWCRCDYK